MRFLLGWAVLASLLVGVLGSLYRPSTGSIICANSTKFTQYNCDSAGCREVRLCNDESGDINTEYQMCGNQCKPVSDCSSFASCKCKKGGNDDSHSRCYGYEHGENCGTVRYYSGQILNLMASAGKCMLSIGVLASLYSLGLRRGLVLVICCSLVAYCGSMAPRKLKGEPDNRDPAEPELPQDLADQLSCDQCDAAFNEGSNPSIAKCEHAFCEACVNEAMNKKPRKCPVCGKVFLVVTSGDHLETIRSAVVRLAQDYEARIQALHNTVVDATIGLEMTRGLVPRVTVGSTSRFDEATRLVHRHPEAVAQNSFVMGGSSGNVVPVIGRIRGGLWGIRTADVDGTRLARGGRGQVLRYSSGNSIMTAELEGEIRVALGRGSRTEQMPAVAHIGPDGFTLTNGRFEQNSIFVDFSYILMRPTIRSGRIVEFELRRESGLDAIGFLFRHDRDAQRFLQIVDMRCHFDDLDF